MPTEATSQLRKTLLAKPWFGFDLDDTLHDFRGSSRAAMVHVFAEIEKHHDVPSSLLEVQYSSILQNHAKSGFTTGKTSFEYRRERFRLLLEENQLGHCEELLDRLLVEYEAILTARLKLKPGARTLLSTLKELGKSIVIITEGPQDSQERTVESLGIKDDIDFLATSNHFQVAKTSGLFPEVLKHLGITTNDIAYVGDSMDRDMKPAAAHGILAMHFVDDEGEESLNSTPPRLTLTTLHSLMDREQGFRQN